MKELADAIFSITKKDPFYINEKSLYSNYSNERYYEYIVNLIWLEQMISNKYHSFVIENSYLDKDPIETFESFESTFFFYKKGTIGL